MPVLLLLAALLLGQGGVGQTVKVANASPVPFTGWKRATVDKLPPHAAGTVGDARFVIGRQLGPELHVVDVHVSLAPGEQRSLDLATATARPFELAPLMSAEAALAHFGGVASFAGEPLSIVALQPDGAAWLVTLRARVGRMFVVTLWVPWYPDQPGWAQGECAVIASNPAVPDMVATAPANAVLQFGNALTVLPGRGIAPFLTAGDTFFDGQGRVAPVTFVWLQHLTRASDWSSVGAVMHCGIGAVGIEKLWLDGNPTYPPGFDACAWAHARFAEAARRCWTWDPPVIGPAIRSSTSGGQEEQFWTRGEPLLHTGAEWVLLFSSLKLHGERPCNHHEADGSPLDLDRHVSPRLLFWDCRPHTNASVNPAGLLGKTRPLTEESGEAHGRYGADNQHFLARTLLVAARITGSPAAQYLLGQMARAYLLQRTAVPGWSTSGLWSQREIGYEGQFVVDVHRNLEDRALAARVVQRWRDRMEHVLIPQLSAKANDVWFTYHNDARLGDGVGDWWQPWMQALAAKGMDDACRVVGPAAGRELALRGAKAVLRDGFTLRDGKWVSHDHVAVDGRKLESSTFWLYGTPDAIATVLRHEPDNEQARAIWLQMKAASNASWMAPGVEVQ